MLEHSLLASQVPSFLPRRLDFSGEIGEDVLLYYKSGQRKLMRPLIGLLLFAIAMAAGGLSHAAEPLPLPKGPVV